MAAHLRPLVIGLGSMGKRRIRNLQALGIPQIAGFDLRQDRRDEAAERYNIDVFAEFEEATATVEPAVFVISTPPDLHMRYAEIGVDRGIHCFIEASVVDPGGIRALGLIADTKKVILGPSCTMMFYPFPRKVKELIETRAVGKPLTFNYHVGQYLPDWHPWEAVEDYYVSKRETGGAREIVPFELTWLNDVFGDPDALGCVRTRLGDLDIDIDDIYHCLLEYPGGVIGNLTVEVISRPKATREFRLLGSTGEIAFSGDTNSLRYINAEMSDWEDTAFAEGTIADQYINPDEPYIAELEVFLGAVSNGQQELFPNSMEADARVLELLGELETATIGLSEQRTP